jgi:hypothetical protein
MVLASRRLDVNKRQWKKEIKKRSQMMSDRVFGKEYTGPKVGKKSKHKTLSDQKSGKIIRPGWKPLNA